MTALWVMAGPVSLAVMVAGLYAVPRLVRPEADTERHLYRDGPGS